MTQHHPSASLGLSHALMFTAQPWQKPRLTLFFASSNCSMFCFILFAFIIWLLVGHPKRPACSDSKHGSFPQDPQDCSIHPHIPSLAGEQKMEHTPSRRCTQTHTDMCVSDAHFWPALMLSAALVLLAKNNRLSSGIKALPKCKILSGNDLTIFRVFHNCYLVVITG